MDNRSNRRCNLLPSGSHVESESYREQAFPLEISQQKGRKNSSLSSRVRSANRSSPSRDTNPPETRKPIPRRKVTAKG